jgi:pyridoxamine 5'-phosphate oxidase
MSRKPPIPPSPTDADYAVLESEAGPLTEGQDPFAIFVQWFEEASASEPNDPNAMAVATVDADGLPDVRMVLLKGVDETGFVFYTNLESAKGRQLRHAPKAALLFHWKSLRRQVRVRGRVERVTDAEADAYFATRARAAQIGAWASAQSRPMESPLALEKAAAQYGVKFGLAAVPRPPHWSGFRVVPESFEFWRSRRFRLHERLAFARAPGGGWTSARLYP